MDEKWKRRAFFALFAAFAQFSTILLHEIGHALTAKFFGCSPIISFTMGAGFTQPGECFSQLGLSDFFAIVLAGPSVSLAIAILATALFFRSKNNYAFIIAFLSWIRMGLTPYVGASDEAIIAEAFGLPPFTILFPTLAGLIMLLITLEPIMERKGYLEIVIYASVGSLLGSALLLSISALLLPNGIHI